MKRKGIPKKRIGPGPGSRERSIRMRQIKGVGRPFNAAERSIYGYMSASLCGIKEEKKEINNEKEVMQKKNNGVCVEVINFPVNPGQTKRRL